MNIGSILIPFLFSFHAKIRFDKAWRYALPAMLVSAVLFLIWDYYFTSWGIWGFNDRYIIGKRFCGMPYEELAFFICIPYACIFTYHCFTKFYADKINGAPWKIHHLIPIVCLVFIVLGWRNYYTMTTSILLLILYGLHLFVWKSDYLNMFLFSYSILLIPFLITNGVLTGTGLEEEVVWYNDGHNLSTRIKTIPIEDIFYGMLLILLSVTIMHRMGYQSQLVREQDRI